jgi:hypothetical protein
MKFAFAAVFAFSSPLFAGCPSVDDTLIRVHAGTANLIDVDRAILCQIESIPTGTAALCETRAGLYADIAVYSQQEFAVGLISQADLAQAKLEAETARAACTTK